MMQETPFSYFPAEGLRAFCRRWDVTEVALFGSALRDDFGPESDLDLLISFEPSARRSLFDLVQMEVELAALAGREVDLLTRRAVERSPNPIRREAILSSARFIFESHEAR